jgi:hypothetical protein
LSENCACLRQQRTGDGKHSGNLQRRPEAEASIYHRSLDHHSLLRKLSILAKGCSEVNMISNLEL